jgi:predicted TIM-barrel fold metal-dependent hydrolase
MLGGGFFTYINMMLPNQAKNQEQVSRFESGNSAIWKRFRNQIFFEMSHAQPWGKVQLECAVSVLGADHILFGTSYPVRKEWLLDGSEFVRQLDISQEEKESMLYKNAEKLYHI